jgi:hypothetical protein
MALPSSTETASVACANANTHSGTASALPNCSGTHISHHLHQPPETVGHGLAAVDGTLEPAVPDDGTPPSGCRVDLPVVAALDIGLGALGHELVLPEIGQPSVDGRVRGLAVPLQRADCHGFLARLDEDGPYRRIREERSTGFDLRSLTGALCENPSICVSTATADEAVETVS